MEGVLELYSQSLRVRENFVAPTRSSLGDGVGESVDGLAACSRKISSVTDNVTGTDVRFSIQTSKIISFTVTDNTTFILSLDDEDDEPEENVIETEDHF